METEDPFANTSLIVPVRVSSINNPGMEKLIYALLDTQSDTLFVDKEVSQSLQAKAHPVRLKLTTMIGKYELVLSKRVSGLCVATPQQSSLISLQHTPKTACK